MAIFNWRAKAVFVDNNVYLTPEQAVCSVFRHTFSFAIHQRTDALTLSCAEAIPFGIFR